MDTTNFHQKKRVLIEHVTDDIRAVQQSNVGQQSTLLTARAIADIFKGDAFDRDRATDAGYYTGSNVDFNKLTDACIRYVEEGSYVNGPESINYSGFISIASVLPGGTLTWDSNDNALRGGENKSVRQIFYPDNLEDFTAYTRVGAYSAGVWTFGLWLPLGGQMLRVKVTEVTKEGLVGASASLRPNVIYELHCSAGNIALPDANKYPTGTKIIFEQYPGEAEKDGSGNVVVAARKSRISYTEPDESGKDVEYATYAIPALDKIRTSAEDYRDTCAWYENSVGAVQYGFEIVDLEHSYNVGGKEYTRTWLLDVDQDAIARTGDLAALIDAHTDQSLADFVRYSSRTFTTAQRSQELIISKQATFAGHFKLSIVPATGKSLSSLTNGFGIRIYLVNESGDGTTTDSGIYDWVEVRRPGALDPNVRYYYNDVSGKKLLAGVGGYVDNWDDINADVLYTKNYLGEGLSSASGSVAAIATFVGKTSPSDVLSANLGKTELSRMGEFTGYIRSNRNVTVVVVIESDNHSADNKVIIPSLTFTPNPHDTYIEKTNINSTALTVEELAALAKQGRPSDMVTSANIVAKIYTDIVSKLQKQGLFFGPRPIPTTTETDDDGTHVVANFNAAIEPGIYTINAKAGVTGKVDNVTYGLGAPEIMGSPIEIEGSTAPTGSNAFISNAVLHVYRSDVYPDNMLKETDAANASKFTRITQVFYGDANTFAASRVALEGAAYEADPLVSVRYGIVKGTTVTWSSWVRLTNGNKYTWVSTSGSEYHNYTKNSDGSYTLPKDLILKQLRVSGKFALINTSGSKINLTVELPNPRKERIDVEFEVAANINPTFTYTRDGESDPYTYTAPADIAEAPNMVKYTFSSEKNHWYLTTAG